MTVDAVVSAVELEEHFAPGGESQQELATSLTGPGARRYLLSRWPTSKPVRMIDVVDIGIGGAFDSEWRNGELPCGACDGFGSAFASVASLNRRRVESRGLQLRRRTAIR